MVLGRVVMKTFKFCLVLLIGILLLSNLAFAAEEITRYEKGYRFEENGWIYIHIEGEPYERGFQHGYLVADELKEIFKTLKHITFIETGKEWDYFVKAAEQIFVPYLDKEVLDEIKGIAAGARKAGLDVSWQEVLTWNGYDELTGYWWPNEKAGKYPPGKNEHCSGFVAVGSYTKNGEIVMAHNSWDSFEIGQYFNVILDIEPAKGNRMFMQSSPGYICSFTDFFVTSAGIMGTETTIAGFGKYDPKEEPEFYRIRKAMQYADDLDEFVEIMKKKNNGGYANSWLLADTNTGEIMRFELGLKYSSVTRTTEGYFIGFNGPFDPQIRNLECGNTFFYDIRTSVGSRHVRLTELMEKYKGRLDVKVGEKILSDHYDVYLGKEQYGARNVEGHYYLDPMQYWPNRLPYQPLGAVDGKVMDSSLAKKMSFWARFGSSSGLAFNAKEFLKKHIQWSYLDGYLKDRPSQPWTLFKAGQN